MKKIIQIITIVVAITFVIVPQSYADFVFSVGATGTASQADIDAATKIVTEENERRAALDPPEDPLPMSTGAELKASYLTVMVQRLVQIHASYVTQVVETKESDVRQKLRDATYEKRQEALNAALAVLDGS